MNQFIVLLSLCMAGSFTQNAFAEENIKAVAGFNGPTLKVLDANGRVVGTMLSYQGSSFHGYTQMGALFDIDANGSVGGHCYFTENNCEGACYAGGWVGYLVRGKTAFYEVLDVNAFQGAPPIRSMIQNGTPHECQNLTPEQQSAFSQSQFKRTRINRSIAFPLPLPLKWGIR